LQRPDGTAVGAPVTPGPTGNYRFDVTTAGDYRVVASLAGFATRSVDVPGVILGRVSPAPFVTVLAFATARVTITGSAATEPSLALAVTQPAASGLTPVQAGAVFTIGGLDPDVDYRFQVTANGFFPSLVPAAAPLNPDVGGNHTFSIALAERTVTVTVTTEDASGAENAATVRLRIPPGSATPISPTSTAGNVYTFARIPAGAGQVTVVAAGYRTQTAAVDASTVSQAVTVNLPRLVTISGTVFAANGTTPVAGATVTVSNGTSTRTAVTAADGTYAVPNLDLSTWNVSAVKLGAGTATGAAVVVTATSPSTVTRNFTLAPRTVAVTFTVQAVAPAGALAGATVSVDGVSQTTGAGGTATVNVPENGPLAWRVSSTNRLTQSGTITLTGLTASVAVTLVDRPTLTGTVRDGAGAARTGATVFLCPQAAAVCDATTAAVPAVTTPAAGTFSFRPDVGTWQVRATAGGNENIVTGIVVGADGSISQNNLTITVP
jgi:Carboxypeptidase regulatory-like domain